ncbi:efflux RND transporter periplasmic adaptor subunit [Desulfoluna sp.]|uniref:efflux RND transporter periplasmic adaptor subunit n=1 Tax=Desulfoluna sp. TaxID=2045199 RepID=UPI00261613F5|nr:efflux RND transporter periplasmic adaptor subunit [Desulfoluna sp.]
MLKGWLFPVSRGMIVVAMVLVAGGLGHAEGILELEGILEPSEVVELSSQVPGIIDEITVDRGDRVKKGEVLARLKAGVEQASVNLARAKVDFVKRKLVRNEELFRKKLISLHEKDELETEIMLSELAEKEAIERLGLRTIQSPVDGIVVKRTGAPGEYIGEGSIMTLARIHPIYVEVIAPVEYLGLIRKGMKAEVISESPAGGRYQVTVSIADHVVDAGSGTFGVRLDLPNPTYKIPAGLKCRVRFAEVPAL